jgi:hypothetical protein
LPVSVLRATTFISLQSWPKLRPFSDEIATAPFTDASADAEKKLLAFFLSNRLKIPFNDH